ncbi:uncharacterized protein VTP21DRAFT_9619 [Calcarisporiella thermophila]|uniref:uncharacterized protein n=1 Tax=Calcarisporiella thermophila TaxID=911321 RepID=UPI0037423777
MYIATSLLFLLGANLVKAAPLQDASKDEMSAQIIGGTPVKSGELPFVVGYNVGQGFCTASLITDKVALTAAHCVLPNSRNPYISYGNTNVDRGTRINIKRALRHPGYTDEGVKDDIALLFLEKPIILGPNAQPVRVEKIDPSAGEKVWAAGFGCIRDPGGPVSSDLLKVDQTIKDAAYCKKNYPGLNPTAGATVCVAPEKNKSVCYGDSGGPLYKISNGNVTLIGVTSFGVGGRYFGGGFDFDRSLLRKAGILIFHTFLDGKMISYFTRVEHYRDWLKLNGVEIP